MTNSEFEKVKRLITEMDATQRADIAKFIREYEADTLEKRRSIRENFNKSLGPLSSYNCPYCGK